MGCLLCLICFVPLFIGFVLDLLLMSDIISNMLPSFLFDYVRLLYIIVLSFVLFFPFLFVMGCDMGQMCPSMFSSPFNLS